MRGNKNVQKLPIFLGGPRCCYPPGGEIGNYICSHLGRHKCCDLGAAAANISDPTKRGQQQGLPIGPPRKLRKYSSTSELVGTTTSQQGLRATYVIPGYVGRAVGSYLTYLIPGYVGRTIGSTMGRLNPGYVFAFCHLKNFRQLLVPIAQGTMASLKKLMRVAGSKFFDVLLLPRIS